MLTKEARDYLINGIQSKL